MLVGMIWLGGHAFCGATGGDAITATRVGEPPRIDGRLDDAVWEQAAPVTDFIVQHKGTPAQLKTTGYVLFTDTALYIGVRCEEPKIADIVSTFVGRDGPVWNADCVEIMLDPGLTRDTYFHFGLSASGDRFDRRVWNGGKEGDTGWNGTWKGASFIGDAYWSCELAIPFFTLGLSSERAAKWGVNLCREKKRNPVENSATAREGLFNGPGNFRELTGIDADLTRFCYGIEKPESSFKVSKGRIFLTLNGELHNATGRDSRVRVECILTTPQGKAYRLTREAGLEGGASRNMAFGPYVLSDGGSHKAAVRILDAESGDLLAMASYGFEVQYAPVKLRVVEPAYRNAVFASQNLRQVVVDVTMPSLDKIQPGTVLKAGIRRQGAASWMTDGVMSKIDVVNRFRLDATRLKPGVYEVGAEVVAADRKVVDEAYDTIRVLPHQPGETWADADGVWYRDGQPFFINAGYGLLADHNEYFDAYTFNPPPSASAYGSSGRRATC